MKVVFERESFLAAFQLAAAVAPNRSPKEILVNVKLQANERETVLTATDMDLGVRVNVAGLTVQTPGAAILPVARLGSILRESSDEKMSIEADSQGSIVRGERSQFKLPSANPDEFPEVPSFNEASYHKAPSRSLRELIRRTVFAADVENARFALGGVLLEFAADKIIAVGTDSRRLAKMQIPAESVGEHKSGDAMTIVPSRSMHQLERMLTDDEDEVLLAARGNDILVKTSRATLYSRLVEGRFPKWRDALPDRPHASRMLITVGPLYAAVRQAAVVASQESRGIDFDFGDNTLVLSGTTADVGESRVEMPIAYDGERTVLSLDHRYVADFLKVLDPDKNATLEIENSDSAALLSADDGYQYVVMPMASRRKK